MFQYGFAAELAIEIVTATQGWIVIGGRELFEFFAVTSLKLRRRGGRGPGIVVFVPGEDAQLAPLGQRC